MREYKHWIKYPNSNQYSGEYDWHFNTFEVPNKHILSIGDKFMFRSSIYTLDGISSTSKSLHCYWSVDISDKYYEDAIFKAKK